MDDVRAVVQADVDERAQMAAEYARLGQADRADRLRAEAGVLRCYLARPDPPDVVA